MLLCFAFPDIGIFLMDYYDKYFQPLKVNKKNGEKSFLQQINDNPIWVAIGLLVALISVYLIRMELVPYAYCVKDKSIEVCSFKGISAATDDWGAFGDYIGGLINPVVGLVTILLLIRSIRQTEKSLAQAQEELQASRRVIELSEKAQKKTEEALNAQIALANQQNILANYYRHKDEFSKQLEKFLPPNYEYKINVNISRSAFLHDHIYPNLKTGKSNLNSHYTDNYSKFYREFSDLLMACDFSCFDLFVSANKKLNWDRFSDFNVAFFDFYLRFVTRFMGDFINIVTDLNDFEKVRDEDYLREYSSHDGYNSVALMHHRVDSLCRLSRLFYMIVSDSVFYGGQFNQDYQNYLSSHTKFISAFRYGVKR